MSFNYFQGVDLSMIVTVLHSDAGNTHPVLAAIENIASDSGELCEQLKIVKTECDIDLSHRCLAGKRAYTVLIEACKAQPEHSLAIVDTLCSLCNGQPDVLDHAGVSHLCSILEDTSTDPLLLSKTVRLIKLTCVKHEDNRQSYVSYNVIPLLMTVLRNHRDDVTIVSDVCATLRVLTFDDDIRVPFGKGHEHAKMIVAENHALKTILEISQSKSSVAVIVESVFIELPVYFTNDLEILLGHLSEMIL